MTQPSNGQFSLPNTGISQLPLSLQKGAQIKFHILLENDGGQYISTLGDCGLQFIPEGQKISNNGKDFRHPLENEIWKLVVECKTLGDGKRIMIDVPFNIETMKYDWGPKVTTVKKSCLWVRIFEVNSVYVAEAADIKASLDAAGRTHMYWQKLHNVIWPDPGILETFDEFWSKAPSYADRKMIEAREVLMETYRAWMRPTRCDVK